MRFVRSLRDLDIERGERTAAIAFVCAPDADALITRVADEVVELGPALRPSAGGDIPAYCDHDHVVRALRAAGCDAVWPGWGFVSEDADFVERLDHVTVVVDRIDQRRPDAHVAFAQARHLELPRQVLLQRLAARRRVVLCVVVVT